MSATSGNDQNDARTMAYMIVCDCPWHSRYLHMALTGQVDVLVAASGVIVDRLKYCLDHNRHARLDGQVSPAEVVVLAKSSTSW